VILYNSGQTDVFDFYVLYGDLKIPKYPQTKADFGGVDNYTLLLLIPEIAVVNWGTADSNRHKQSVAIKKFIDKGDIDAKRFKVIFDVNGPTLKVYIDRQVERFKYDRRQIN